MLAEETAREMVREKETVYGIAYVLDVCFPVHGSGDHVGHGLRGVVDHRHAGQLLLDGAVGVDPAAELDARGRVFGGLGDHGPHGTGQGSAHAKSSKNKE